MAQRPPPRRATPAGPVFIPIPFRACLMSMFGNNWITWDLKRRICMAIGPVGKKRDEAEILTPLPGPIATLPPMFCFVFNMLVAIISSTRVRVLPPSVQHRGHFLMRSHLALWLPLRDRADHRFQPSVRRRAFAHRACTKIRGIVAIASCAMGGV